MNSNVCNGSAGTGELGIHTPGRLFLPGRLQFRREEVLYVRGSDIPNFAYLSILDHFLRLAHHWVTRIILRQKKYQARLAHDLDEFKRLLQSEGHWLIADHVEASLEKRFAHGKVKMIRRHDRYGVDAVWT